MSSKKESVSPNTLKLSSVSLVMGSISKISSEASSEAGGETEVGNSGATDPEGGRDEGFDGGLAAAFNWPDNGA